MSYDRIFCLFCFYFLFLFILFFYSLAKNLRAMPASFFEKKLPLRARYSFCKNIAHFALLFLRNFCGLCPHIFFFFTKILCFALQFLK